MDMKDFGIATAAGIGSLLAWLSQTIHPAVAAAGIGFCGIAIRIVWEFYKWQQTDGRRLRRLKAENKALRERVAQGHARRKSRRAAGIHTTDS